MNQLYYSLFFLWKWSLLTMNTAKVSDNEVSICRRNPCVSKAQASCYSKYSFRHFIFTFGAFLMSYAHISGYEDRSSTYLLFMLSLWGAANQRKVGLKRWTESKSSLFQTGETEGLQKGHVWTHEMLLEIKWGPLWNRDFQMQVTCILSKFL